MPKRQEGTVLVEGNLIENPWPFTVELLPRKKLFSDSRYQRPPQEAFINRLVGKFDPTLVGTLDVSAREDGYYALLDGLQRNEVVGHFSYDYIWCAVYEGMSLADEAEFFFRRNKDRKGVHPFYQFQARVVMGERIARKIDRIVRAEDFWLHINAKPDDHISAIRAVEDAFSYSSPARKESLSPALRVIRMSIFGRQGAKDGEMIRGLARFFQPFEDEQIDLIRLRDILESTGPKNLVERAKEKQRNSGRRGSTTGYEVARELATIYNRGLQRGPKLSLRMLQPGGSRQ
jgi:hypothetical protein